MYFLNRVHLFMEGTATHVLPRICIELQSDLSVVLNILVLGVLIGQLNTETHHVP
jgi:hypothetical protein